MRNQRGLEAELGKYQHAVDQRLDIWENTGFIKRLWEKDTSLWPSNLSTEDVDRLGWLDLPEKMGRRLGDFEALTDSVWDEDYQHIILLGMGGSSLAPVVYQEVFGRSKGLPELFVLDSTHPAEIQSAVDTIDLSRSLFLVSSKSGTTLETLSLFRYFWEEVSRRGKDPGRHFIAVTDQDSPLETLAQERGFRRIFLASPDVGGRFSALSYFGLIPAALIGIDISQILDRARTAARENGMNVPADRAPGLLLGAALGEVGRERDKLTFVTSRSLRDFPVWVEQLIAESLGKKGRGIIPIADEPSVPFELYGNDRLFVLISLEEDEEERFESWKTQLKRQDHPFISLSASTRFDLGSAFFSWEIAVSSAAALIGIYPFDQPDVQLTKELTRSAMQTPKDKVSDSLDDEQSLCLDERNQWLDGLKTWLQSAHEKDYIAIQAFLPRRKAIVQELQDLRSVLLERTGLATTMGIGPRFLHSTGQLHKGGPGTGLFLQLVDEPELDLLVPETDYSFTDLIKAQSLGDYQALIQRNRNVIRINLNKSISEGLRCIKDSLHKI